MADRLLYFAYGSNMLPARLLARCPSARLIGPARVRGYSLRFWKHGMDGSAKATLVEGPGTCAGALFALDRADLPALDRAEGAGRGYDRHEGVRVVHAGRQITASSYVAPRPRAGLRAFDWYLALVLAGARLHDLPATHQDALRRVDWQMDPQTDRPGRMAGLAALAAHGIADPSALLAP